MALSNTATPIYYGEFRDAVLRGEIPVCETIAMQMNRVDDKIANPNYYYDDEAINGFIAFCETELTLTDGSELKMLDSFKLWAEDVFAWFEFIERSVFVPGENGRGGHYVRKRIKKRLVNKQYLIPERNVFALYKQRRKPKQQATASHSEGNHRKSIEAMHHSILAKRSHKPPKGTGKKHRQVSDDFS